jgi:hypothetical protein
MAGDIDFHGKFLALSALEDAFERGNIGVIPAEGDLDVVIPFEDIVSGIESDPELIWGIDLHPSVAGGSTDQAGPGG